MPIRIGELLLKEKRITADQLQEALVYQRNQGGKLASNLVKLGFVRDEEITALLSKQYGVPSVDLSGFDVDTAVLKLLPAETARKYSIVPLSRAGATLTIAMADPTNVFAQDDIKFMTGYNVEPVVASETAIVEALARYYGEPSNLSDGDRNGPRFRSLEELPTEDPHTPALPSDDTELDISEIDESSTDRSPDRGGDSSVIRLVNAILMSAIQKAATDIHIEPYQKDLRVRFRIDGTVYTIMNPPLKLRDGITARIKIMAKLDIAERRLPQDGRIKIRFNSKGEPQDFDVRVSSVPTLYGERIAMRILNSAKVMREMTNLGLEHESLLKFQKAISKSEGLVIVTGPIGSGKTTTLYASLARISTPEKTILTAEDPVQFDLPGICQVQVRESIGLSFAAALRTFLRQDADAIVVGEIRDSETATIALKAALSGQLILSAMHTNDAPGVIARLVNMGLEPFLVASALSLVSAQRLVRRICPHCIGPEATSPAALLLAGFSAEDAHRVVPKRGKGCANCDSTGYHGRIGLFEVLEITEGIRDLAMAESSTPSIRHKALEEGLIPLRRSGLQKVKDGVTTLEEVLRET